MPRFSTIRQTPPQKFRPQPPMKKSTPRQRMLTCLFLPIWLLIVVNAHVAIGFFKQVDDKVLVNPVELTQDSEEAQESPFEENSLLQEGAESVVEGKLEASTNEDTAMEDAEPPAQGLEQNIPDSQVAQQFFIEPDENGDVFGRLSTLGFYGVSPIAGRCEVVLVQDGVEVLKTTATNGEFLFQNVPTGTGNETYTLVAHGPKGFLAQTVNIGNRKNEQSSHRVPTLKDKTQYVSLNHLANKKKKQDFDVPDGQLDLPDLTVVPDLQQNSVLQDAVPRSYQVELVAMEPSYTKLRKTFKANVPDEAGHEDFDYDTRPTRADLQSAACFEYELNDEGGFCGRIVIPDGELEVREFTDMKVFLQQGSQQVAEVEVDTNGDFEFEGIVAGPYGLVAAGSEGFAAVPVSLVNNVGPAFETGQAKKPRNQTYVSLQDDFDPCGCCRVPLVCQPQDVQYVGDVLNGNVPQFAQNPSFAGPLAPAPPIQYQGIASGGFAPSVGPGFGGGFAAPAPVVSGGGFAAPAAGFGGGGFAPAIGGSRLARLGLIGGIVALALSGDSDEDLPASPNDL